MLASGLAVEGGGHGGGLGHSLHFAAHHHPHMAAFSAPPVPEFLRPLPKPAPLVPATRYNGGPPSASGRAKYESPVNLAQQSPKEITEDDYTSMFSSRFFPPPPPHHLSHYSSLQGPYGALYPGHYTPMLPRDRPGLPPPPASTPLSPLEAFPSPHSSTPDSPSTFSPPSSLVTNKVSLSLSSSSTPSSSSSSSSLSTTAASSSKERKFKVPSGKEGSLKHRILTTTPATAAAVMGKHFKRKHTSTGAEVPASFSRGSLIQLANGELRRVEDMRTEDFVSSAERSPALRLDPSTVIRIEPAKEVNLITLSYGEHRTQVEIESAAEHPYFVFNRGWASCDPDKTLTTYGLKCHRLQVGDVCISLSPRPQNASTTSPHTTAQLSATTAAQLTAASAAQLEAISSSLSSSASSCKKRRWSAPDQLDAILGAGGAVPPPQPTANSSLSAHRKVKD